MASTSDSDVPKEPQEYSSNVAGGSKNPPEPPKNAQSPTRLSPESSVISRPNGSTTRQSPDNRSSDSHSTILSPSPIPGSSEGDSLRTGSYLSLTPGSPHKSRLPPVPLNIVFMMSCFSLTSYIIDVATDLLLVYTYYNQGAIKEGSLTLTFVLLPCVGVLMDRFYRDAFLQTCTCSKERMKEVLVGLKDALFIWFTTVKIYVEIVHHAWIGYWKRTQRKEHRAALEKLHNDAYGIRFYESTFEALPQLYLQTILTMNDINDGRIQPLGSEIVRILTIISSLVSISWGITSYISRTPPDSNPYTGYQMPFSEKILNFLGHLCVLGANVLAVSLSLIAVDYAIYIALVIRCFVMVTYRKCDREKKIIKNFSQFSMVIIGICVSSDDGDFNYTHRSYVLIFLCDFIQNTVFIAIWHKEHDLSIAYEYSFVIGHYVALMVGLLFMMLFYWRRYVNLLRRRKSIVVLSNPLLEVNRILHEEDEESKEDVISQIWGNNYNANP